MKRSPMPARKTPMKRTTPLPRRSRGLRASPESRARKAAERLRAYGGTARIQFVKTQRCFGCHSIGSVDGPAGCENAHLVTDGMGRKADADKIIALCPACHREQHATGNAAFAAARGMTVDDLFAEAARLDAEWRAGAQDRGSR